METHNGLKSDIPPCPYRAKPGHRDRFIGKKGDYLPDKLMRCNRVAETTPNVKRYITVRFDGWNSDERRALHSATSLARQNASPLARSPRYSVARIGGCCDGRGGTNFIGARDWRERINVAFAAPARLVLTTKKRRTVQLRGLLFWRH
jgi:hypothetical protein